tara:strand:- start:288 stop:452 length:165 start_codon:yes stop_codon:yes gene_type:complete
MTATPIDTPTEPPRVVTRIPDPMGRKVNVNKTRKILILLEEFLFIIVAPSRMLR